MIRRPPSLPTDYAALVCGTGPRDIAIRGEAHVELMKGSGEQRAGMAGAVMRFAESGFSQMPARMRRLGDTWHPTERAPNRVLITALTPEGACAFGFSCTVQGRATFFITDIALRDASAMGEREIWDAAGKEALRLTRWAEDGGRHGAVSATR